VSREVVAEQFLLICNTKEKFWTPQISGDREKETFCDIMVENMVYGLLPTGRRKAHPTM
jgi:hypothetical protein